MARTNMRARHLARRKVMQALYQWLISEDNIHDIEMQFLNESEPKFEIPYFQRLLHAIAKCVGELDSQIEPLLDRALKDLDPVELSILRLSTFELQECLDIPYRVVINEALELAKQFGASESHKYVNGILDKLARIHRQIEIKAEKSA